MTAPPDLEALLKERVVLAVGPEMRAIEEAIARQLDSPVSLIREMGGCSASEADYLRIITQKTASFISACCRIGALVAGAAEDQVEALTRYGLDIGIAFQLSDDSLDFVADQGRLGKAIGADLKEGKRTLPLIATLERAAPAERDRIQSVLKRHSGDPGEIEDIRQLVERYGGVEYALGRARAYAQSAKEALAGFSSSDDKDTLLLIADFVVARHRHTRARPGSH